MTWGEVLKQRDEPGGISLDLRLIQAAYQRIAAGTTQF
jgi:hypothetical protein